jgi:hypothetical protein
MNAAIAGLAGILQLKILHMVNTNEEKNKKR